MKKLIVERKNGEKRKEELEAEIDRYTVLAGKAKMMSVIAQYEKKIEKLADELEVLEGDTVADYDYGMPYRTALDKVIGVLKDPYITWVDYDVFEQQKFFNFLFEQNLSYDKKEGCRTPKYTVLKRVLEEIEHSGSGNVGYSKLCAKLF